MSFSLHLTFWCWHCCPAAGYSWVFVNSFFYRFNIFNAIVSFSLCVLVSKRMSGVSTVEIHQDINEHCSNRQTRERNRNTISTAQHSFGLGNCVFYLNNLRKYTQSDSMKCDDSEYHVLLFVLSYSTYYFRYIFFSLFHIFLFLLTHLIIRFGNGVFVP